MTPLHIFDQPITNFPSALWLREVAREDFNEVAPVADAPARVPAATESRLPAMVARAFASDVAREDAGPSVSLLAGTYTFPDKRLTVRQAD